VEVGDVFGDGVNIASRIEASTPAGSIYVSESVNSNLTNKKGIRSELIREEQLKNVKDPVKIYRIDVEPQQPLIDEDTDPLIVAGNKYRNKKNHRLTGRMGITAAILVAVLAMVYLIWSTASGNKGAGPNDEAIKSIVVLPFENLGATEDDYFADGITDEITSRLGLINGLSIISPVSAKQYKNTTRTMAEIASELGVDYVLAGSIRWDKSGSSERVRITTNLSNVSSNRQLWGDSFVRELKQIFEVQSEIAEKVASALDVTLLAEDKSSISVKATENLEAYDLYLRAQSYMNEGRSARNYGIAEQMLEKAVRLDPDFALAYSSLSHVNIAHWWFSYDRDSARIAKSKYYLGKAQSINADLPEVQGALGVYYYHGFLDYEKSLEHLLQGLKIRPNDPYLLSYAGYVNRRQGKFYEAINYFQKALKTDPLSEELYASLAETLILVRDYDESLKNAEKANSILPDWDVPYQLMSRNYVLREGNLIKAIEVIRGGLDVVNDNRDRMRLDLSTYLIFSGEDRQALEVLSGFEENVIEDPDFYISRYQIYAQLYHFRNDKAMAKIYADSARVSLQQDLNTIPNDSRIYGSLGIALSIAGQKDQAVLAGEKAVELLPIGKDAWRGHLRQIDLTVIYCHTGEYDKALEKLDYLLSLPGEFSVASMQVDPNYESLRDLPAYAALVRKYTE
jgi:TolB-like protein/Flp pilus assembly protein TadD